MRDSNPYENLEVGMWRDQYVPHSKYWTWRSASSQSFHDKLKIELDFLENEYPEYLGLRDFEVELGLKDSLRRGKLFYLNRNCFILVKVEKNIRKIIC